MKLLCTLLMAVVALHAQCLGSCYAMHDISHNSTSSQPCHGHEGDKAPSGNPAPDHDNECGIGPVTPLKTTSLLEIALQTPPPLLALSSILYRPISTPVFSGDDPPPNISEPALRLNLRI
jgi:hypothetical protein